MCNHIGVSNFKELKFIKLSELGFIDYINEVVIKVLEYPSMAVNTFFIKNTSSILLKIEKNGTELARVIITEHESEDSKKIWYISSLLKKPNGESADISIIKEYLDEKMKAKGISGLILNVRGSSEKGKKSKLEEYYEKMGFIKTEKTLHEYLKEFGVKNIKNNLLKLKYQLVREKLNDQ